MKPVFFLVVTAVICASCAAKQEDPPSFPGNYSPFEVVLSQEEAELYVAADTSNQKQDQRYMNVIDQLLARKAAEKSSDENFIRRNGWYSWLLSKRR